MSSDHLSRPSRPQSQDQEPPREGWDGRPAGAPIRLALEVADSGSLAARLAAAGAKAEGAVVETPWGHRNARLRTPEGLSLTLFTEMKRPG